ncbi:MAG: sigma-70 family RNA polymerase sigma factor [Armatimonadota bacterium]|nr:sigma-70 family RNA polymerase sigma factor [bacterium]
MNNQMVQILDAHRTGILRKKDDAVEIWLQAIHDQYSPSLFRYALALTGSVEDAQDAVGEVFTRIAKGWKRFMEVRNVNAYLFSATRNSAYSVLRRRRRGEALHDAICVDLATAYVPQDRRTSATVISIREAFSQITLDQREVLVLRILHQMTFKEISEMVGASTNTIYARYRCGIDRLRQVLDIAE